MITMQGIDIYAGDSTIIRGFGVTVFAACALNIYGPNGSGKTSLLRYIAGLNEVLPGQIFYNQIDVHPHIEEYMLMAEYVGHNLGLREDLSVYDNLGLWAKLYGNELTIAPAVRAFGLDDIVDTSVRCLSMGTKKRVALARLLVTNSEVWLLDEPFANLDERYREVMWSLIKARCEQNGTVIMTNHGKVDEARVANLCVTDFHMGGFDEEYK